MRTRYYKARISIIVDYGDATHNPDEIKPLSEDRVPYIKYEGVWYKCRSTFPLRNELRLMDVIKYLFKGTYSKELFFNKLLNVVEQ